MQLTEEAIRQAEAGHVAVLEAELAAGPITDWRRGTEWVLLPAPAGLGRRDAIKYRPDFEVWTTPMRDAHAPDPKRDGRCDHVRDVKGTTTDVFRLKARLWRHVYPTIPLVLVAKGGERVVVPPFPRVPRARLPRSR